MNKIILNKGNVVRYCSPKHFTNGKLQSTAFMIKDDEKPLSVNWIEYFNYGKIELAIQGIREEFDKIDYELKENGRFVKINILSAKNHVQNKTGISLIFKKAPYKHQPSHSEIHGYKSSDIKVATELLLIAQKENCYFPGIEKL